MVDVESADGLATRLLCALSGCYDAGCCFEFELVCACVSLYALTLVHYLDAVFSQIRTSYHITHRTQTCFLHVTFSVRLQSEVERFLYTGTDLSTDCEKDLSSGSCTVCKYTARSVFPFPHSSKYSTLMLLRTHLPTPTNESMYPDRWWLNSVQ